MLLGFQFIVLLLKAQTAENIIDELKSINQTIINIPCTTGKGNMISNGAMNIFLSNKVGTYLSGDDDLSLYKNSITFNSSDGVFAVNHNMRQEKGLDEPVKSFLLVGAKANVLNGFASMFNNRHYVNDFGMLIKKVWMGKTTTCFNQCNTATNSPTSGKQLMDAERSST
jgi:hypothetical protein